jgi:hypothetical protein
VKYNIDSLHITKHKSLCSIKFIMNHHISQDAKNLQTRLKIEGQVLKNLYNQGKEAKREHVKLEQQLERITVEYKKQISELEISYKKQLKYKSDRMLEMLEVCRIAGEKCSKFNSNCVELTDENKKLKDRCMELEDENKRLKNKNIELEDENNKLKNENEIILFELDEYETEIILQSELKSKKDCTLFAHEICVLYEAIIVDEVYDEKKSDKIKMSKLDDIQKSNRLLHEESDRWDKIKGELDILRYNKHVHMVKRLRNSECHAQYRSSEITIDKAKEIINTYIEQYETDERQIRYKQNVFNHIIDKIAQVKGNYPFIDDVL